MFEREGCEGFSPRPQAGPERSGARSSPTRGEMRVQKQCGRTGNPRGARPKTGNSNGKQKQFGIGGLQERISFASYHRGKEVFSQRKGERETEWERGGKLPLNMKRYDDHSRGNTIDGFVGGVADFADDGVAEAVADFNFGRENKIRVIEFEP